MKLVIGDRNYSSWSLRPWLAMKQIGLPFEEVNIRLSSIGAKAEIFKHSPSGKVPCLIDGETLVWDSLAICEYLAEKSPTLWPAHRKVRAEARSISAEMHSGFRALRRSMAMDIHASKPYEGRSTSTASSKSGKAVAAAIPRPAPSCSAASRLPTPCLLPSSGVS
jgi:glutathione S-transferase